jgi:thiamine pyrophosphate-dependent acetolactate synthase large subunit-like protein
VHAERSRRDCDEREGIMNDQSDKKASASDGPDAVDRPAKAGQFEMDWGSDLAAEMLRTFGIDYIALNPGASYRGLHDSLVNYLGNRTPQMLVALHEEHAVAMAHGYAKVTGKPMAVALHSNVGLMHGTMAVFNAWCDRVPMFILGATGPLDANQRRPWIEWIHTNRDQASLLRPYIKWDDQPASPEATVESMLRAWKITRTPPHGPVYVCLDLGLQERALSEPVAIPDPGRYAPDDPPAPSAETIARAVELLTTAERPLIMAGRVSRDPVAWQARVRLAELLDARVLTDLKAGAAFPTDHPLHPLPPIKRPTEPAKELLGAADVILGLEWIDPAGTFKLANGRTDSDAQFINCSLDSQLHTGWSMEHHILPAVDVGIPATPDDAIAALLPAIEDRLGGAPRKSRWGANAGKGKPPERPTGEGGVIDYQDIADALEAGLDGKPATVARVPLGWPGYARHFRDPLDFLGGDGGAGIGSGPGMAVGVALGLRETGRIPVAILGDGDTLMGMNAFWTAARYRVPLLVIVANNRSYYNDELHQERVAIQRGRPPENKGVGQRIEEPTPDLCTLVRGFGWEAEGPVTTPEALHETLARAVETVAAGGRVLVDVHMMRGYDASVVNPGGG